MNETQPESEINFDFLQDEVEWLSLLEACRQRWSQIGAPLLQMEAEFLDLQRPLLQEDQPSVEAWDRLLEDFAQSPARSNGLRPYIEAANVAPSLLTGPAGSLDLRDAAALRLKLDRSMSTLLGESISSADLRDALLGGAARVASRPDFYRATEVSRDKQRRRLRMEARVPHYYTQTEASPGAEQTKGAEPRLVGKLRVLAEWHLRHDCNAWHVLRERRVFWTNAEQELRDFLRQLFPEPVASVPQFVPVPAREVMEQDTRTSWVRFKDWIWNATIELLFPRLRRHKVPKALPPPAPPLVLPPPQALPPKAPRRKVKLSKVPASRELWPILHESYRGCEWEAGRLDEAGRLQDDRIRSLEDHMATILAEKQALERGIDVAGLRAESITRDLGKHVDVRCTRIEGLAEFIGKQL
jgi:hypothetical protein